MQDSELPPEISLPEQLQLLNTNAETLAREGRHDDAERVVRQVVEAAPHHVPGLQYLASRALARNEFESAQGYLERAIRWAPRTPMLHQNLGIVLRARGFSSGALKAFCFALRINPKLGMIWVQLGDVLQSLGRHEEALAAYCRSELIFGFLLRVASETPGRVGQTLARAGNILLRARAQAVDKALEQVRRRYPAADELARAESAVRTILHTEEAKFSDPLQRPEFAYFPGIEARPFFDRRKFPFLRNLEQGTGKIRHELELALREREKLRPYVNITGEPGDVWRDLNHSAQWSSYHLYRNSELITEHCKQCPETYAVVESLPMPRLPGQSPEVFFSILHPGTHIPPHCGLANYKLTVHLPLILPSGCAIRVGDQTRNWRVGESLVFDDSFEHEAWNKGDSLRAVLILEAWHPDLRESERELLGVAFAALTRFNRKYNRLANQVVLTEAPHFPNDSSRQS